LLSARLRKLVVPARDIYGIRVGASRFGYKSLGKSGDISKAQHCRAEVWLRDYGWVPVDPADVRKVVLEERPGLTLRDQTVVAVREKLFGAWETNWLPYNTAHDVALPGSSGPVIPTSCTRRERWRKSGSTASPPTHSPTPSPLKRSRPDASL
jgi:transglutaminase-like putative cysteine protease